MLDGEIEVRKGDRVIATRGPGTYVGEIALLDHRPRTATVVAKTPVSIEVIGQREFAGLLSEVPEISQKLIPAMAKRLADLDERAFVLTATRDTRLAAVQLVAICNARAFRFRHLSQTVKRSPSAADPIRDGQLPREYQLMTSAFPDAHEDLQRALDRNELLLAYQPIVDLNDGSLGGVEALLRWNHPTRGLLWPGDFLAAIEGTEVSTKLGSYVIDEAAGQAAAWRSQTPGQALPVAINVSGSHFESDDLVVQLAHALRTNDLEPGTLALEVGERTLFRDVTRNRARIESLKHLGAQIVVDDFGTAYATATAR